MENHDIYITNKSHKELEEILYHLKCPIGYGPQIKVKKDKHNQERYIIETRDHTLNGVFIVILHENKIIVSEASPLIEKNLRDKKIAFEKYERVPLQDENSLSFSLRPVPNLIYSP